MADVPIAAIAAAVIGAAAGLGAFTFVYAKGASYLSTDPAVCASAHRPRSEAATPERSR